MLTYTQACEKLATARKGYRKLENNTYLDRLDDDTIGVRLHGTYVVKLHSDGTYTLNSGGWQTVTTKDRINGYSPAAVYQSKHVWYVVNHANGGFSHERTAVPFRDGMRVDANGNPVAVAA